MTTESTWTHGPDANVDETEIEKFSELASRWWDPHGEFKPLHGLNPLRLSFIDQHAPLANTRVLDIGCGGGILSESMAKKGAQVTGIDMSEAALNVARLHALDTQTQVDYRHITAESLCEEIQKNQTPQWDCVTCLEMLEHVPDPQSVIRACYDLVKPGGSVFFSTINRHPKAFFLAIVGAEYVLNLLPRGTHQYEKFIKPSELGQWCEQSGLRLQHMTGMHYNPISQSYRLGDGVDVNYLVHTIKPGVSKCDLG